MAASALHPPYVPAPFEAVPRRDGPGVVVVCRGELDLAGAPQVARVARAVGGIPCTRLVLDLTGVAFIDASGIRAIGRARRWLAAEGVEVVVRDPQPAVRRALALCGLDGWLDEGPAAI